MRYRLMASYLGASYLRPRSVPPTVTSRCSRRRHRRKSTPSPPPPAASGASRCGSTTSTRCGNRGPSAPTTVSRAWCWTISGTVCTSSTWAWMRPGPRSSATGKWTGAYSRSWCHGTRSPTWPRNGTSSRSRCCSRRCLGRSVSAAATPAWADWAAGRARRPGNRPGRLGLRGQGPGPRPASRRAADGDAAAGRARPAAADRHLPDARRHLPDARRHRAGRHRATRPARPPACPAAPGPSGLGPPGMSASSSSTRRPPRPPTRRPCRECRGRPRPGRSCPPRRSPRRSSSPRPPRSRLPPRRRAPPGRAASRAHSSRRRCHRCRQARRGSR